MDQVRDDPKWQVNSMKKTVKRYFGIVATKQQLHKAKRRALQTTEGDGLKKFCKIWDNIHILLKENPGSIIKMKVKIQGNNVHPTFERLFISFHGYVMDFIDECRSFIGLNRCYLKSGLSMILLCVVSRDISNQIFAIVVAQVESECKKS